MADYPISNVSRRIVYTGSAGVGPYDFPFEVLIKTDLKVYKNTTLLTVDVDYTVTISPTFGTGSITLAVAASGSDTITIIGNRAIQRTSDFTTGGDLFANTLNDELDSQTIFIQQIDEKVTRAITAPETDPTTINMVLPVKASRASKYLAFDSNGNPIATAGAGTPVPVGTLGTQDANAVAITGGTIEGIAITGGSINNATIGNSTPAAGSFTSLTAESITQSISSNAAISNIISNTNSGASASAKLQLTSNAGTLSLGRFSTAGGNVATIFNTGGGLFLGTSDSSFLSLRTNATDHLQIDAVGNVLKISSTGGLGYGVGAGGTVTQLTNKATGVTLDKATGQITLAAASLAAATIVSFTLTNSAIAATDVMIVNHVSAGTRGAYLVNAECLAGSATISIRNNSAAALAEAIVLRFVVIKGAIS